MYRVIAWASGDDVFASQPIQVYVTPIAFDAFRTVALFDGLPPPQVDDMDEAYDFDWLWSAEPIL